jgi:hypothetical protein
VVRVNDARRSLRLRLRAPAELRFRGARHDVVAEDLGADGCRITAPLPFRRGEAVHVTIFLRAASEPLSASGTVVWSIEGPPHHAGVTFARTGSEDRERLLREVLDRDPALAQAPAPLRPGQHLRLGPVPPPGTVLGRDELAVLRAARDEATVLALLDASGPRFREVRAALDTLRVRGLVHEGPRRPPPLGWGELLRTTAPEPPPRPDPVTNPFGPLARPLRAVCCLEVARDEAAHGHRGAAVEWLQEALAAAPGDAEISAALEELTTASE